jgi:hypothetical protein
MIINETADAPTDRKFGKLPAKSSTKALLFEKFVKAVEVPDEFNFWKRKAKFPSRMFGNDVYGDCTRASQAEAAMHMERIETKATPRITDAEVIRAYFEMTWRRYSDDGPNGAPMPSWWMGAGGPGDLGAYETDALSDWRRPEFAFTDSKGRPLTIDAFTSINHQDQPAIKSAIYITGGHGIKFCLTLPDAWLNTKDWSIPEGQPLVGAWLPKWGHSLAAFAYNKKGLFARTWGDDYFITWEGVAAYCDETHWILDSMDKWRKTPTAKIVNFKQLKEAVNDVSSQKIV